MNENNDFLPGMSPDSGKSGKKSEANRTKPARPLFFSFSRLSLYEECPQKYKFRYIDKIPEKPKSYFAFGHSIHAALEFLYRVKSPPFPSMEEVLDFFEKDWNKANWIEKGYASEEAHMEDFGKGAEMLKAYYKKHMGDFKVPFLVEYSSDVELDGLKVRIIADKIDYIGGGKIIITDYKTGKNVKRSPEQLYMYQKICESDADLAKKIHDIYGESVDRVVASKMLFYHVPSLNEYSFERATEKEIAGFWERVLSVADNIRAAKFDPNPGEFLCRFCDFRQYCPLFAGKKYVPEGTAEKNSGLRERLERYARLKKEEKELVRKIREIKEEILADLADMGAEKCEIGSSKVNVAKREKWEITDRNAIISILKENNLYDKVCAPLLKNLVLVLKDETIPGSIRTKMLKFAKKTETKDLLVKEE